MMAGVVRRDGLREAVTALCDKMATRPRSQVAYWTAELSRVLNAVPPADDQLARVVALARKHAVKRASPYGVPVDTITIDELSRALDAVPDVSPDPPAVGRDELANVLHLRYHSKKADRDCAYFNHERCRIYAEASRDVDHLLSSGVLVDAADVRARALEDAADEMDREYVIDAEGWLRNRAVSEREARSRPPADTDTGRGQ